MTHPPAPTGTAAPRRRGQLALAVQETLTTIVRLRAGHQVAADADSFRAHVRTLLAAAEQEARQAGYGGGEVRLAVFAVVAFLDESVLTSGQPMFAGWAGRPMQDEIFGAHIAGELFFQYLQQLLTRDDSDELADVLEVYELCLLLGFQGRYSATTGGELSAIASRVAEKIQRIRGGATELSPAWRPPTAPIEARARDPWLRWMTATAISMSLLAVVLYATYRVSLGARSAAAEPAPAAVAGSR